MKKNRTALVIVAAVMILTIGGLSAMSVKMAKDYGYSDNRWSFEIGGKASLRNTIEIPVSQVEDLEVIYGSNKVILYPAAGDQIVIKEYLCSDHVARVEDDGNGKVSVRGERQTVMLFGIGEKIEVYIPETGLRSLLVQTGSGSIHKDDGFPIQLEELEVSAGSGSVDWQTVNAAKSTFSAGSGSVKVQKVSGQVTASAGSGSVKIYGMEGFLLASAGSGSVKIEDLKGGGQFSAGSGSVKIGVTELTDDISIETNSGGAHLTVPTEASFKADFEVGSGGIHTNFDDALSFNGKHATGQVGNDPVCSIRMKAGSGSVHIDRV